MAFKPLEAGEQFFAALGVDHLEDCSHVGPRRVLIGGGFTAAEYVRWRIHPPPLIKQTLNAFTTVLGLHGALRVMATRG